MADRAPPPRMMMPKSKFPTIADFRDRLSELVEQGLGDLPAQILVVPDSSLQAIAAANGGSTETPALMVELRDANTPRAGTLIISTEAIERLPPGQRVQ